VEEVCCAEQLAEVLLVLRRDVAEALGKRAGERLGCARIVFPDERVKDVQHPIGAVSRRWRRASLMRS